MRNPQIVWANQPPSRSRCRAILVAAVVVAVASMAPAASAQTPAPAGVPAASAEVATWLTQTSAQCEAAYQRDVRAPFEAGLATLRQSYLAAIVQAMEKAGEARKLDEANAFRQERERFLGARH